MRKMSEAALKILKERYFLKDDKGNTIENWEELCRRVAGYIASVEEDEKLWEIEFFEALHNRMFLPNTPTLMNAGKANMGSLHACISGDTLVVTESGLKRMDNIHIGDNVLTHKGRFRRVNNIYNNGLKETIGIFRGDNKKRKSANIFLTEDHKILDENSNWVQAKDVVNPMYPFVADYTPVKEYDLSTHTNRGLADGKKIKPIARKHSVGIPKIIKNDLDLAWLLGFYIAEGNISKNEILRFTIHKKEKKFQDKIYKVIYEKTGLHCNTQYSNHGNWMTITCGSVILCDFMKNLIGHGFSSKKIPWTVFAENSEYKKEFLQGINDGDGCSINNGETKLVLANQTVIYQCVLLSRSIGKYVTYKANYSSKLQKTPTSLVSTIKLPTIGSTKINGTLQTVYDIEVEEDHSFVAGDLICHNCFVYPITDSMGTMDSMDSISDSWKAAALIGKEGGGIGYAFSDLRPKGDFISTSKGTSSGPISFMKVNDAVAEAVKQGGTRRIAQMGILNVHHPDILEFIKCKNQEGQIKNFNISVAITDKFMEAVRKNKDYELINPATKKVVSKIPAKDIWDEIVNGAWINGEPGVVFIDTINKHHNLKKVGEIKATNPCSEQPLLPLEACVLGSVDVGKLVENKKFNWEELDKIVAVGTRFLDNTVTLSKAPIKEINETVANNRKIGLGIMGFADCLIQLGITYGSDESFAFAEQLAKRIKETAHKTSVDLGKEKGLPLNSKNYENTTPGTPDLKGTPRNACQISYAPTGTIASIADASFGIEPLYDVCFIKNILDGKRIFFVSDIVAKHLKDLGYEKAVKEIESGKSLEEIDIPKKIKDLFATALTLKPEQHVNMQAAFQKYCDSAISKTCNLPNKATKEDVSDIYFMAYDLGCKGITVYRDGSRQLQVIEIGKGKKESSIVTRPDVVHGVTYKIPTSFGKLYMTVNREEETPIEVFFSMADISNDMNSLLSALGRTLSVSLKHGTPLKDIIKTLKKIKVGTVVYYNGKMFKSVPQLIAGVLEEVFAGKPAVATLVSLCDKCGSQLILQEGCEKCSNSECGYTKCG